MCTGIHRRWWIVRDLRVSAESVHDVPSRTCRAAPPNDRWRRRRSWRPWGGGSSTSTPPSSQPGTEPPKGAYFRSHCECPWVWCNVLARPDLVTVGTVRHRGEPKVTQASRQHEKIENRTSEEQLRYATSARGRQPTALKWSKQVRRSRCKVPSTKRSAHETVHRVAFADPHGGADVSRCLDERTPSWRSARRSPRIPPR